MFLVAHRFGRITFRIHFLRFCQAMDFTLNGYLAESGGAFLKVTRYLIPSLDKNFSNQKGKNMIT